MKAELVVICVQITFGYHEKQKSKFYKKGLDYGPIKCKAKGFELRSDFEELCRCMR